VRGDASASGTAELTAPTNWQVIDFISDLHLGEDTPRGLRAFADYLRTTPADAVFILGDLFEVWVGDDARGDEFEARCARTLREGASRCQVAFMAGNRDFLLGEAMLRDCGMLGLADPTVLVAQGQRLLLTHGDALCVADTDYQQFRRLVRGAAWQSEFLAHSLPVRRAQARRMRTESRARQRLQAPGQWFDVDAALAVQWLQRAGTTVMIHGHTHRPGSNALAAGYTRHVLSDWEFDHDTRSRAEVLRLSAGALSRLPLR